MGNQVQFAATVKTDTERYNMPPVDTLSRKKNITGFFLLFPLPCRMFHGVPFLEMGCGKKCLWGVRLLRGKSVEFIIMSWGDVGWQRRRKEIDTFSLTVRAGMGWGGAGEAKNEKEREGRERALPGTSRKVKRTEKDAPENYHAYKIMLYDLSFFKVQKCPPWLPSLWRVETKLVNFERLFCLSPLGSPAAKSAKKVTKRKRRRSNPLMHFDHFLLGNDRARKRGGLAALFWPIL